MKKILSIGAVMSCLLAGILAPTVGATSAKIMENPNSAQKIMITR